MKGYFSSLIEQTGITFRPGADYRPDVLKPISGKSEESNDVTPIHAEERKVIDPQTENRTGVFQDEIREGNEYAAPVIENSNVQGRKTEKSERKISEETESYVSERESQDHQKREPKELEEQERTVLIKDFQASHESVQSQQEYKKKRIFEKDETVCRDTGNKDNDQLSDDSSVLVAQEEKRDITLKEGSKPDDLVSKKQILQTTLKEVREWVTEGPDGKIGEIQSHDVGKSEKADKEMPTFTTKKVTPPAFYQRPSVSLQRNEPEINDFHLSIGTISLTIEDPQKDVQDKKVPQIKTERKSVKESNHSRLSRHYLRIR
jgi:hypothetical protein